MDRKLGIVRIRNDKFGFISVADEEHDRFFRFNMMSPRAYKPFHHLHPGDKVTFIPHEDSSGRAQATDIEPVISKRNDTRSF